MRTRIGLAMALVARPGLLRRRGADPVAATGLPDRATDRGLGAGDPRGRCAGDRDRHGAVEGEFAFELYGDEAPVATANFVNLARCGFYEGIWFHRSWPGS